MSAASSAQAAPASPAAGRAAFRMFGSAVVDQALLSAASLAVGLLLIRYTEDVQYGYYVLVFNALLLLTSLQNAFVGPPMVIRLTGKDLPARGALVGGLYRDQSIVLVALAAALAPAVIVLWMEGVLDRVTVSLVLIALVTALACLNREFLRLVLLAHRQSPRVLRADVVYCALMVAGAAWATTTEVAAPVAVGTLGLAATCGGLLMFRAVREHLPWNSHGERGTLRRIVPLGAWSASGAAIHWSFSQGYAYVVAAVLDVTAVAALAATRLLMMPVNLLSTGITSLMLPMTSDWLRQLGVGAVARRLALFAGGVALAAVCYFGLMWILRDWIFATVLRKDFPGRDTLLALWSAIFLLSTMRDQLIPLLIARARFRVLTALTAFTAVMALALSWWGMLRHGQSGALVGMLFGEGVNLAGIVGLVLFERHRAAPDGDWLEAHPTSP